MGYPITAIALDPTSIEDTLLSNDTLYVGTDGYGIMRSTNGGSSWSFVNTGIYCKSILDIKVDPVNNSRVYAGGTWSFYVSTDYGQTWTERIQGMKKAEISGVASNAPTKYCIGEFDNLYKSTDSGNNWLTIYAFEGKPGFEGSDHIKAKLLAVNKNAPSKPNPLFATVFVPSSQGGHNSDRILRSTDGGLSWQVVFDPTDSGLFAMSLVIDPQDSNKIYATYDDPTNTKMVMKSASGGDSASWSAKVSGLPNDGVLCLTVDPVNHNTLYVGTKANGVYKNIGAGDSSWTQTGLTDKKVRSIGINADNVKELYAGTSVGVYRSGDTGASWSLADNGMTHKDVYSLAIELDLSPEIYAACLDSNSIGHLYKSTNSGTNWSSADSGLPSDWVVFADDVPYISLQTDTLSSISYVFLGTSKGLFKLQMPSYSYFSDYINQDTTWGPGTLYLNGDVTVASEVVLTIDSGTSVLIKPNFDSQEGGSDTQKCELIVNGSLSARGSFNDSIKFISSFYAPSDSDWYGIKIGLGGSARFNYCNLGNAYTAIYFTNSTHDSVTHCRFRNNFMHAIKTQNSNLVIDSCVIENDSLGGSDETYGILCYSSSPTIKNTLIKDCKYAIKCDGPFFAPSSPLIEECGFYDIRETGIWCGIGSHASIKNSCFKGDFGKTCIQVDISGSPLIRKCYMASEGSGIPIGMLFLNGATGNVRRSTIWDYDSCAVQIASPSNPDFGTSDSVGNNWFERNDHYYFRSSSYCTIKAESNNWETNDSVAILNKISGNVDFSPFLDYCTPPIPYYPDICSNLPPDDPTISPCKIAATSDEKMPKSYSVSQNYPNPFNPSTMIKYDLPKARQVRITIYNILGQKVRTVVDEDQEAGYKSVNWDGKDDQGKDVSTGIYFYQIKVHLDQNATGDFSTVKKMILLK